jgi:hypothetical protein
MPQPFLDISFPGSVARGATGGPGFSTQIVTLASGAEQRNVNWSQARDIPPFARYRPHLSRILFFALTLCAVFVIYGLFANTASTVTIMAAGRTVILEMYPTFRVNAE